MEYRGVGYGAKWWTRGEAPGADADNTSWEEIPAAEAPTPTTTTTTAPSKRG